MKNPTPIGNRKKDTKLTPEQVKYRFIADTISILGSNDKNPSGEDLIVIKYKDRFKIQDAIVKQLTKPSPTPAYKDLTTGDPEITVTYGGPTLESKNNKLFKCEGCHQWVKAKGGHFTGSGWFQIDGHKCQPPTEENSVTARIKRGESCIHNPLMVCEACRPTEEKKCVFRACACDIGEWWCSTHEQHKEDCPPQRIEKTGKLVGVCNGIVHCGLNNNCITHHDESCEHEPLDKGMEERFDEFAEKTQLEAQYCTPPLRGWVPANDGLKEFIAKELAQARQEALSEAIGIVEAYEVPKNPDQSWIVELAKDEIKEAINSLSGRTK